MRKYSGRRTLAQGTLALSLAIAATLASDGAATASAGRPTLRPAARTDLAGSEVQLTKSPRDHQLFPRDPATNNAVVDVAGNVTQVGASSMRLDIARDGEPLSSSSVPVNGAGSAFAFAPRIQAGLNSYSFSLYSVSGSTIRLQAAWSDIVAGDVFIVNGQSNAAARQHFPSNPNNPSDTSNSSSADRSPWVRTFGSSTSDPTTAAQDDTWQVADGDSYQVSGAIGQYALRLGRQEVNTYGVPIAFLQGGHEGRPITFFQRDDANPTDPGTNYGRLLGRARRAGVQGQVRGIFWYQGESDNNNVAAQTSGFTSLLDDWKTDYPGVEHVYAHQIRNGCLDAAGAPQNSYEEREAQRQYASLHGVTVLSTTGISGQGPDNCHYYYVGGYRDLADRDFLSMARDYYGGSAAASTAPDPQKAWFSKADHTEITIGLRTAADALVAGCGPVTNFVVNGSPVSVASMAVRPGFIHLRLTGPATSATGISYVGHDGAGPWITNSNGIGLLAFYNLPFSTDQAGTFPAPLADCPPSVPAPTMARTVGADFNGDGKQDIAGIDANSNMKLYTGDGAGSVGGGSDMLGSNGLWKGFKSIAAADFNGDGKQDIAGIDANNNLKLYTGDGAGHLSGGTNMLGSTGLWKGFTSITAADFNGDGKQDISGIDANSNLKLYTGNGTGTVSGGTNMLGSTGLWKGFTTITAADYNGDGKQDIAGIDANNNLKLYTGDGTGTVGGGTNMLGSNGLWKGFRSLLAADFNSDGKQDIAGIDANNNMKLYTGNGAGTVSGGTNMLGSNGLWSGF
ncbi:FG-GAP-like repeat-containing protein [Streptomyces sp. G-G2]|uniref:FG-GAP-like repeat-containing protein n=1 Tax=Streptomyces sp. G-G2 TaxID=3046201 RepID=UPI0024BBE6C2|nr:FG-GAP-like repeat-containing protein [Streptomyces sp. G-G2]MDJ0380417.1 FG-GAP-like repeat-containing protein [Streptomyces sp. G-G2]